MNSSERKNTDHLNFEFACAEDILAHHPERLDLLLDLLEAKAGELMQTKAKLVAPSVKRLGRQRKYSRQAIHQLVEEECAAPKLWEGMPRVVMLLLERSSSPIVELNISCTDTPTVKAHFSLRMGVLPFTYFTDPAQGEERSRSLVALVRECAIHFPPLYATAHSEAHEWLSKEHDPKAHWTFDQIHEVYWLNVLGEGLVEKLGRERVLSTPTYAVEVLPGGSVLLLTHPTPDITSDEALKSQARALAHLRPELTYDTVLSRLRERSQALVPVTPAFHPAVEPLLSRIVQDMGVSDRPRTTSRLNAYRPPEVSQWTPLAEAPPADVEDVDESILLYEGVYAEQFASYVEKEVPSAKDFTLESLWDVDFTFWAYNYPDFQRPQREVMAVRAGAYLGRVMVERLGGRWVPRKEEAQTYVVLGERAWFPLRRANDALESRDAVIDNAFAVFYREAEQHLRATRAP